MAVAKKKRVVKKAPVKRKKKSASGGRVAKRKLTGSRKETVLERGKKILAEIDRLEAERSKQKDKSARDFYAQVINKEHKKLSQITKNLK